MSEQALAFSEVVDGRAGVVRAAGHLTVQAADLLSGAVLTLRDRGHSRVLLDLGGVHGAEDGGLHALRQLETVVSDGGGRLVVLHPPSVSGR